MPRLIDARPTPAAPLALALAPVLEIGPAAAPRRQESCHSDTHLPPADAARAPRAATPHLSRIVRGRATCVACRAREDVAAYTLATAVTAWRADLCPYCADDAARARGPYRHVVDVAAPGEPEPLALGLDASTARD